MIRAFNRGGEHMFCPLCARTIFMALEDGELPASADPENTASLSRETLSAEFFSSMKEFPEGVRFQDRYGRNFGDGIQMEGMEEKVYLHKAKDRTGKDDYSLSSLPRSTMMPSRLFSRLLGLRGMLRCLTPSPMSLRYIPLMRLHQVTSPDVLSSVMPISR
jgi:hypothetical protein